MDYTIFTRLYEYSYVSASYLSRKRFYGAQHNSISVSTSMRYEVEKRGKFRIDVM